MIERSNSANTPIIWNIALPDGVGESRPFHKSVTRSTSSPPFSENSGISMLPVEMSLAASDILVIGRTISALIMTFNMTNSTTKTAESDAMKV